MKKCLSLYLEIQRVDGEIGGLLLGESLGCTDSEVISSDEGIKLVYTDGKVLATILVNVNGITLGLDVGT